MTQENSEDTSGQPPTDLNKCSIKELVELVIYEKDDDYALSAEYAIHRQINNANVREIEPLFLSEDPDSSVAALRCLSDGGVSDLSDIYHCVDLLFERDRLVLKRLSTSLIHQHDYYHDDANKRMAQFIDSNDEPLRRDVRGWLIWRSIEQLQDFMKSYKINNSKTIYLIEQIIQFKSNEISLAQFFERIKAVDAVAFREYLSMSKYKWGKVHQLFHGNRQIMR